MTAAIDRILRRVHNDFQVDGLAKGRDEDAFVAHYSTLPSPQHRTLCVISIDLDFPKSGSYRDSFVVTQDFHKWMQKRSKEVELGEVDGKHSDVRVSYQKFHASCDADDVGDKLPCVPDFMESFWEEYCNDAMEIELEQRTSTDEELPEELCEFLATYTEKIGGELYEGGMLTEKELFEKCGRLLKEKEIEFALDLHGDPDADHWEDWLGQAFFESCLKLTYAEICERIKSIQTNKRQKVDYFLLSNGHSADSSSASENFC